MLKKEAVSLRQAGKTLDPRPEAAWTASLPIRMPPVLHIDSIPPARLSALAAISDHVLAKTPVKLEFAGIGRTFHKPRLLRGDSSHWVFGPADTDPHRRAGSFAVPADARLRLKKLLRHGIDFPLTYVAHEVHPSRLAEFGKSSVKTLEVASDRFRGLPISHEQADQLIGPVPLPLAAQRKAERLGQNVNRMRRGAATTVSALGSAVASTLGGLLSFTDTVLLDPMIIGAMTADGSLSIGEPAVWFVLARWDW